MGKVYNSTAYKISKALLIEGPEAIKSLDKAYNSMVKYGVYSPIKKVLYAIKDAKESMKIHLESAAKVKTSKGRVE